VPDGRNNLDLLPLHFIPGGGKYKMSFESAEILMKNSIEDTKWLKDNFEIDYASMKTPDNKPNKCEYGKEFFIKGLEIIHESTDVIKYLSYSFFEQEYNSVSDGNSRNILKKLLKTMKRKYSYIDFDGTLESVVAVQEKRETETRDIKKITKLVYHGIKRRVTSFLKK